MIVIFGFCSNFIRVILREKYPITEDHSEILIYVSLYYVKENEVQFCAFLRLRNSENVSIVIYDRKEKCFFVYLHLT